jgi:hypothetical protein
MDDAAAVIFQNLDSYSKLVELVDNGEAEGLHLECKAPIEPRLNRELKAKLAEAASGFSNTTGGVILWGVSTTKHSHSGLDVISQLEPIGNVQKLAQQVEAAMPTLTTPAITNSKTKILLEPNSSTRGIGITYVPMTNGDPVQSNIDHKFHFRNGDEFTVLPYVMLKRLFSASDSPDLEPFFRSALIELKSDGVWEIPVVLKNQSSAVAEHVNVLVVIENPAACEVTSASGFKDISSINPKMKILIAETDKVIHRGFNLIVGTVRIKMKVGKLAKRSLKIKIQIFANRMRAREWQMTIRLAKTGFSVTDVRDQFIY